MRNIREWFGDNAHLGDLNPRYDRENDDHREPFVLGEAPQREWIPRARKAGTGATAKRRGAKRAAAPTQPKTSAAFHPTVKRCDACDALITASLTCRC